MNVIHDLMNFGDLNFKNQLEYITYASLLIILLAFVVSWIYIKKQRNNEELFQHKRTIEQLPSLVSTLGVLGTFLGITLGLLNFDTQDLNASIPLLLDGLKTAFFTSLAGMLGSLILSKTVNSLFDEEEGGISDIDHAAREIVKSVQEMSKANKETLHELKAEAAKQCQQQVALNQLLLNHFTLLETDISNIKKGLSNVDSSIVAQSGMQQTLLDRINKENMSQTLSMESIDSRLEHINIKLEVAANMDRNIGEILDSASSIVSVNDEIAAEVKSFGGKLHAEVVEIEDKMDDTNKLLTSKFDEFTNLLKKSNTEALVEVMKNVTKEFQTQMSALINKLVQENFDQLNKSVERLNTWQQENKEMISSLTRQYMEMANNFENTSTTLNTVRKDTQLLVSDGGKLEQIVDSLNQIMIEDKKFVEITTKLADTVELTQSNIQKFDDSNKILNDWVKKQRNFVEGVQMLILKLDELNRLRDYNEQFWQSTKRSMEEGVNIVSRGSQTLSNQLTNLDQRFYNRLASTLANLDACIQAMIDRYE